MSLAEFLYALAFSTFMVGVALAFRRPAARGPVLVMATGATADFLVTVLPQLGLTALDMNVQGRNLPITLGAIFGVITWTLFVTALVLRWRGRTTAFLAVALLTQLVWFADYLFFLYGMHVYPLR